MKTSISEISKEILELYLILEEQEGEITEEQLDYFQNLQEDLKENLEDLYVIINQYNNELETLNKTVESLKKREKSLKKRKDYFEYFVRNIIFKFGKKQILPSKNSKYTFELNDCNLNLTPSEVVEIDSEDLIENRYKRFEIILKDLTIEKKEEIYTKILNSAKEYNIKENISIDKKEIKKDLKKDLEVEGASLGLNYSLRQSFNK